MQRQYFTALRGRLLLLVFIAVLPAFGLILYGAAKERAAAAHDAKEQALRVARFAAEDYARLIGEGERLLSVLAQIPSVRNAEPTCPVLLAKMLDQDGRYANLGVIGRDGLVRCSALRLKNTVNLADRAYFQRTVKTRQFAVGDFQIGRLSGKASVNLAYPILNADGEISLVLFSALDLSRFSQLAAAASLPERAVLTVVDPRGTVLTRYPESANWVGRSAPEAGVIGQLLASQREGTVESTVTGDARFYAYTPLKVGNDAVGVYVGVAVSKGAVLGRANATLQRELIVFGLVLLIGFVAAWFGSDAFVLRGIHSLIEATRRIAAGNLSARSGLGHRKGELGELAMAFDAMAESLERRETELTAAQSDRDEAKTRFAGILDIAAEAIIAVDEQQKILLFNHGAELTFGYSGAEIIGQPLNLLIAQRFHPAFEKHIRLLELSAESTQRIGARNEIYGLRKSGKQFPAEISISKLARGGRTTYTVIMRDVTERKQAEEEIRLLQTITLAVSEAPDLSGAIQIVLKKVCEVTNWDLGQAWLPQPGNHTIVCCPSWHVVAPELEIFRAASLEPRIPRDEGLLGRAWLTKRPVWITDVAAEPGFARATQARAAGLRAGAAFPVIANDEVVVILEFFLREPRSEDQRLVDLVGAVAAQLGTMIARKRSEDRLKFLAHYDELTGLPNRTLLTLRLAQAMLDAEQRNHLVAVAILDLDRFKAINDSLGHAIGDQLLNKVGKRLSESLYPVDTIARLSGDAFGLVLPEMPTAEYAARVIQKVTDAFARPISVNGIELFTSASIGFALYPAHGIDAGVLLRNAEVAMYRVKGQGRNHYQLYTAEMTSKSRERLGLEHDLRYALDRGELAVHYQPVIDLASGKIEGSEALLRWHHPERGMVSPADFIPAAEETGLILAIGEWVLEQACRQVSIWSDATTEPLSVAVNVSARQFRQKGFVAAVASILARTGLDPKYLELELTESLLAETDILNTLNALSEMGIRLSVDDFGTGYSALSYLKRFPIDTLKIDQSFIREVTFEADTAALTSAMITMAHALGIRVIAEGVETATQLQFLKQHGCDFVQGYYFSPAVTPQKLAELMPRDGQPFPPAGRALKTTSPRKKVHS